MNAASSSAHPDRDALKRAAAEAAVQLVQNDMVVGLGSGSTAAFAVEALARRQRQGLRFVGIPTSERTAAQAAAAGATAIVAGTAIFGAKDYAKAIAEIRARATTAVMMS